MGHDHFYCILSYYRIMYCVLFQENIFKPDNPICFVLWVAEIQLDLLAYGHL